MLIDSVPLHGRADARVLANCVPNELLLVQQAQAMPANTLATWQPLRDAGACWVGWVTTKVRSTWTVTLAPV